MHRNLIKENWEQILYDCIVEFQQSTTKHQYIKAIMRLTAKLDDSHSGINMRHAVENEIIGEYTPDCLVQKQDNCFVVNQIWGNLLNNNQIKHGDIILKLNNEPLAIIYERLKPFISSSNQYSESRDISRLLLLSFRKENKIDFIREGFIHSVDMQFNTISSSQKSYYKYFDSQNKKNITEQYDNISYVNISKLNTSNFKKSTASLEKKIILDFRNGINHRVSLRLFYYLLPPVRFFNATYPNLRQPGSFKVHNGSIAGNNGLLRDRNVVILVDENTQSETEFVVMAFQQLPNVKTIGGKTAGADGNVCLFIFPGNIRTTFTSIGIRYKDNKETQQCGIRLDEELYPDLKNIQHNQDTVLEHAIEILKRWK